VAGPGSLLRDRGAQTRVSLDAMAALPAAGVVVADLDEALTDLAKLDARAWLFHRLHRS